jgi:hypothetical protein
MTRSKNTKIINSNFISLPNNLKFVEVFLRALEKKNVLVNSISFSQSNNRISLRMGLFFNSNYIRLKKLGFNKLKLKKQKNYKSLNKFKNLFFDNLNVLRINLFSFVVKNLNNNIQSNIVKYFYLKLKRYIKILFSRRFDLFLDIIRLTALLVKKEVSLSVFLFVLVKIFCTLSKKKHNQFFFFIRDLFKSITYLKSEYIDVKGVKFIINGKFQGKPRAKQKKIVIKSVPIQTISSNIFFSKKHAYSLYGVFGFKLWFFF